MRKFKIGSIEALRNYFGEDNAWAWDKNGYAIVAYPDPEEDADILYVNITRSVLNYFHCDCLTEAIVDFVAKHLTGKVLHYHFDELAMEYTNVGELPMMDVSSLCAPERPKRVALHKREEPRGASAQAINPIVWCSPERPRKVRLASVAKEQDQARATEQVRLIDAFRSLSRLFTNFDEDDE